MPAHGPGASAAELHSQAAKAQPPTLVTGGSRPPRLLESGVWISSTSRMRPRASTPNSYLVSTSSSPRRAAARCPCSNSASAAALAWQADAAPSHVYAPPPSGMMAC